MDKITSLTMRVDIVKEMMVQRGFKEYKSKGDYIIGRKEALKPEHIYIKMFEGKLILKDVREFLSSKFMLDGDIIRLNRTKPEDQLLVVQLVIICQSFQNAHVKEFRAISNRIQLIKSDFFNINITKKAPAHHKIDPSFILNKKEIPILRSEDDPNCTFYNFKKGDLIRIVRSDGDICYRLVK